MKAAHREGITVVIESSRGSVPLLTSGEGPRKQALLLCNQMREHLAGWEHKSSFCSGATSRSLQKDPAADASASARSNLIALLHTLNQVYGDLTTSRLSMHQFEP